MEERRARSRRCLAAGRAERTTEATTANPPPPPKPAKRSGWRALVVETDPATLRICRDVLESSGFVVEATDSGIAAVVAAREALPDLIFVDLQLRDVSGPEAIGWLRSNPALESTPIIVLTTNAEDDAHLAAARPSASLRKPVSAAGIRRTIAQALKNSNTNPMPDELPLIIQKLLRDHGNMARLLDVLQEEVERYRETGRADFQILSRILDYVLTFPELRHHPREDLIFQRLKQRNPAVAHQAEAIMAEHHELASLTRKLSAALHNLRHGIEMQRDRFEALVRSYIKANREHMRKEEEVYFPLAIWALDPVDWQDLDCDPSDSNGDPLFGDRIDAQYQALHDRILRLTY